MGKSPNRNIKEALELSRQLTILADEGEASSRDDGCAVLYGVVRDCAYKIKGRAEREREIHREKGLWDIEVSEPEKRKEKQL
jgi:hypothetical protein